MNLKNPATSNIGSNNPKVPLEAGVLKNEKKKRKKKIRERNP